MARLSEWQSATGQDGENDGARSEQCGNVSSVEAASGADVREIQLRGQSNTDVTAVPQAPDCDESTENYPAAAVVQ